MQKLSTHFTLKNLTIAISIALFLCICSNPVLAISMVATLTGHSGAVWSVKFSPDGKLLASGGGEGTVKLWDVAGRQLLATLSGHSSDVTSVAFSPSGNSLATGSLDKTIKIWSVSDRQLLYDIPDQPDAVSCVAFYPNSNDTDFYRFASSSWDNTIKLWALSPTLQTIQTLATLSGRSYAELSIAFSPDGKVLASGTNGGTIQLWDVSSFVLLESFIGDGSRVSAIAFSPDGKMLANGGRDISVKLWDFSSRKILKQFMGHNSWIYSVAFSPDGKILASGSDDNTIKLWDVSIRKLITTLSGHSEMVCSVAFSPDGKLLASGSMDGTIKLWDISASPPIADFIVNPLSGNQPLWVYFADSSKNDPTFWSWDFGDGITTSDLKNTSHLYKKAGCYTVKLTVSNSAGSDTKTKECYINVSAIIYAWATNSGGSIAPSGTIAVSYGGSQTFTITPKDGYMIKDVTVNNLSVGAVNTYTFNNVTENSRISAQFEPIPRIITATTNTGGSIIPSGPVTVRYGESQRFIINPKTGYRIKDIKMDGLSVSKETTYTFTNVTANHSIAVEFELIPYKITASAGTGGSINPSGSVKVSYGTNQTFTITPNPGYRIKDVKVNIKSVGVVSTYTFTDVRADQVIDAVFERTNDVVKGDVNGDGKINSRDALLVSQIAAGIKTPTDTEKLAADMDNNGVINSKDTLLLLRKIVD